MGKKSRDKGAAWEREVARLLTHATGTECRRQLRQYQVGGSDIDTSLPLAIECKTGYRISVTNALEQAEGNAEFGEIPFVWVKQNRKGKSPMRYIVIDEHHFLPMLLEFLRLWVTDAVSANAVFKALTEDKLN